VRWIGRVRPVTEYRTPSRRDLGVTALVSGFFASAWFGWGQATRTGWELWLNVGSVAAIVVAVIGAVLGFRSPASTAALRDPAAARRYGIIVGIEFGLAGLGAVALGVGGQARYIPVWVCAVVGVHFFPLAPVLGNRLLIPLAVLLCVVAAAALVTGLATGTAPSLVTGAGAGGLLLVFGAVALGYAVRA
jgi:hypothetical protein